MKTAILTAFGCLVALSAHAAEPLKVQVPLPASITAAKHLTVGINCQYPPAGYVDLAGKPAGFEYTIVKRIAEFAFGTGDGLQTQCVNDSNRIPFIQSGKVDFVLASLARTPARAEQIEFSNPIWLSNLQVVVPKASAVANYADLAGKKVVTTTGSTYQTWIAKCVPQAELLTAQSPADASAMLMQGRADAFGYVDVYAYNLAKMNPNYKVVGALASPAVQGIGLKKDDKPLLDWLNAVIERLRQEDAFYQAFSDEVKNPAIVGKFRDVVPGPNVSVSYTGADYMACK